MFCVRPVRETKSVTGRPCGLCDTIGYAYSRADADLFAAAPSLLQASASSSPSATLHLDYERRGHVRRAVGRRRRPPHRPAGAVPDARRRLLPYSPAGTRRLPRGVPPVPVHDREAAFVDHGATVAELDDVTREAIDKPSGAVASRAPSPPC